MRRGDQFPRSVSFFLTDVVRYVTLIIEVDCTVGNSECSKLSGLGWNVYIRM